MKQFYTLLICLLPAWGVIAQINNPVQWSFTAVKRADKVFEIDLHATISPKWHLYAQDAGEGPEPTSIQFAANPLVVLDGKVQEIGKLEKAFDPNFNSTLRYFSNEVRFRQKVKLRANAATLVKGTITYMVCNDRHCFPPREVPFSINLPAR